MYSLLKQLKEAGFPQREGHWICEHGDHITLKGACEAYYNPSSDELIEELGKDISNDEVLQINYFSKDCTRVCLYTYGDYPELDSERFNTRGSSPKEALINLYLALHKHA